MDLDKLLCKVHSKESFLEFLDALRKDKEEEDNEEKINPSSPYSSGANGWENSTVSEFLDAIYRFGLDNEEITQDWKSFALLLYTGKFYERR